MTPGWGLSAKLIGYVAAGVILTSAVIGFGRAHTEREYLSASHSRAGQSIANATAAGAASLVAGYDYGNLEILAQNISHQAGVVHVLVRNQVGRTMSEVSGDISQSHKRYQAPILFDNKVIGEVVVDISSEAEEVAMKALYWRIVGEQFLFGAILGLIVYWFTSRGIVSPIHNLTTAMEATVEKGEPYLAEDLPIPSRDEVGRLVMIFNNLNRALANYYDKLQQKIDSADQALKNKNIELVARTEELEHTLELLSSMATTDWLTKLPNRRQFDETFERMMHQASRFEEPLTLVLFDIDHFKRINDTHGHAAGDEVLRHIGSLVQDVVRKADSPARLGGDEFAIILYHTEETQSESFIRQLIDRVKTRPFQCHGLSIPVTISVGAAEYNSSNKSPQALYFAADKALYSAKHRGRDQYAFHSQISS